MFYLFHLYYNLEIIFEIHHISIYLPSVSIVINSCVCTYFTWFLPSRTILPILLETVYVEEKKPLISTTEDMFSHLGK